MRRCFSLCLLAAISAATLAPVSAAPRAEPARRVAASSPGQPPHAWLFGTWSGGMFPPQSGQSTEQCLSQPVLIFTRDLVMRALLTDQLYDQRLIETARSSPTGADFRFVPAQAPSAASSVLGIAPTPPSVGFSCESPDVLHVVRKSENEIELPSCADFPYPLVRCPAR